MAHGPRLCKLRRWQVYRRSNGTLFGRYTKGRWRSCASLLASTVAGADYINRWVGDWAHYAVYYFN